MARKLSTYEQAVKVMYPLWLSHSYSTYELVDVLMEYGVSEKTAMKWANWFMDS
jgi:hypothetical protein